MSDQMAILIKSQSLLVNQLDVKDKQLEAQRRRIEFLEFVLEQRGRETLKQFDPKQTEQMYGKVYQVFLENPGRGLTYEEVGEEFERLWHFHTEHTQQRVRDLFRDGKVWRDHDESGAVQYYLTLVKSIVENPVEVG